MGTLISRHAVFLEVRQVSDGIEIVLCGMPPFLLDRLSPVMMTRPASDDLTIGKRIRARRRLLGINQDGLASGVGVSRSAIAQWETDRADPTAHHILRLAEVMGTTTKELLGA